MPIRFPSRSMDGLPELSIGGWLIALEPASALPRLHRQQQRPAEVFRCPGDLLHQDVVATKLVRSEEHTSELQSHSDLVCRLLLEKKKRETDDHRGGHKPDG